MASLVLCSHRRRTPQACPALQLPHLLLAWQNSRHLQDETQLGAVLAQAAYPVPPLPGILLHTAVAAAFCSSIVYQFPWILPHTFLDADLCSMGPPSLHSLAGAR